MNLSLTFWNWLLALAPVLVVVVLMLAFRWGGSKAGGMGWFVSILVAVGVFGARFELLAVAQVKVAAIKPGCADDHLVSLTAFHDCQGSWRD